MNNSEITLFKVPVLQNIKVSKSSVVIRLPKYSKFKAGQVINISTSLSVPPRMYSIASGEQEDHIDILFKIIDKGELTPLLKDISVADSLLVSKPFGGFLGTKASAWLIATGTGIAPYHSMLRSGFTSEKILLHGSREAEDFYYSEYLKEILGSNYIQCYTGNEANDGFKGRVSKYISEAESLDLNIKYYLCGSAEMVVETRQILIGRGVSFKNILSEIYF